MCSKGPTNTIHFPYAQRKSETRQRPFFFKSGIPTWDFKFQVSRGIKVIDDKLDPILNLTEPQNVQQLKSFLGMIAYYHKHVPFISLQNPALHVLLFKGHKSQGVVKPTKT